MSRARAWLSLDGDLFDHGARGPALTFGRAGHALPELRREINADAWREATRRYLDALDAAERNAHVVLGPVEDSVQSGATLRRTQIELWSLLFEGWLPDPAAHEIRVLRTGGLLDMPVAPLVAAAHPEHARSRCLPIDLHPQLFARGPLQDACRGDWPMPSPDTTTLLVAEDLQEGELWGDDDALAEQGLAVAAVHHTELERAMECAAQQGVDVVRSFSVKDFIDAVLGQRRPFVQVIAHIDDPESPDGSPGLVCADGVVDLHALRRSLLAEHARGFRTKARAFDLTACGSSETVAPLLIELGVPFVCSFPRTLQTGWVTRCVERIHRARLLDGATWFSHAWLLAAM